MCPLESVLGDCCRLKCESSPCCNEDIINVGRCRLEGSKISHLVHYCITIQIIELSVWTVILWMVMHTIIWLDYELLDVVFTEYFQWPIIKMSGMAITVEPLGIKGRRSAHGGKIGHGFMPTTTIHISWQLIVDYPITGYVVMEILPIVCSLVRTTIGGMKHYPSARANMRTVHQNGDLTPVLVLHSLSYVKNLYMHTILFQLPLGSNPILSQFHTCDAQGWMSCRIGRTTYSLTGRLSYVGWYIWECQP